MKSLKLVVMFVLVSFAQVTVADHTNFDMAPADIKIKTDITLSPDDFEMAPADTETNINQAPEFKTKKAMIDFENGLEAKCKSESQRRFKKMSKEQQEKFVEGGTYNVKGYATYCSNPK